MSNQPLLPNSLKKTGWIILIPASILGIATTSLDFELWPITTKVFCIISEEPFKADKYFTFIEANITNTLVGAAFIIGALMVAFSKEKHEDEFIAQLRLSSLQWAVIVNYALLLIALLFIYGTPFFTVMVYNMFTVLIIFIIRFNYLLYKNAKALPHEE